MQGIYLQNVTTLFENVSCFTTLGVWLQGLEIKAIHKTEAVFECFLVHKQRLTFVSSEKTLASNLQRSTAHEIWQNVY